MMGIEAAVAYWRSCPGNMPGGTGHNHGKRQSVCRLISEPEAYPAGNIRVTHSNATSGTMISVAYKPLETSE